MSKSVLINLVYFNILSYVRRLVNFVAQSLAQAVKF